MRSNHSISQSWKAIDGHSLACRLGIVAATVLLTLAVWPGRINAYEELLPLPDPDPVNAAPEIVNFGWRNPAGSGFFFEGQVIDENPGGLTVTFGGVLTGHSTTTAADGSFSYGIYLTPDDYGLVTAQTADEFGVESNIAETVVY